MHESLHPKTLSTLSVAQRVTANSAMNGSVVSLRKVVQIAAIGPSAYLFCPVFHRHLDPAKIPGRDAMDTEIVPNDIVDAITRAFLSLEGIFNLIYPPKGSEPDLWQRVWPWIQFFDVYKSCIPGAPMGDVVRERFFSIVASLATGSAADEIALTPGIGVFVAQFWADYFKNLDPQGYSKRVLRRLSEFIAIATQSDYDFEEYIDGAGGVDRLAKLVVQLVDYLASWDHVSIIDLAGIVAFAAGSGEHRWSDWSVERWALGDNAWISALRSHKYAQALMSVLSFAGNAAQYEVALEKKVYPELYRLAWSHVVSVLSSTRSAGYSDIVDVIHAGVLQLVISLPNIPAHRDAIGAMRAVIKEILHPATIYYPVLSALETSIPLLAESSSTAAFISSVLYVDWQEFVSLVMERLDFKKSYDSDAPTDFMDSAKYLTSRDRSFVRAVVMHDYESNKERVFLNLILQMRLHGESLCTIFNYSNGRGLVGIQSHITGLGNHFSWRGARSGRRMHLNLVVLPDGCRWMLPIRSSDSGVHDALFALSQSVPYGIDTVSDLSPEIRRAVSQLIEEVCPTVVEIV
ncbi:hypothetical protein C8R45DRAFT_1220516 [Mycena sanguinolenta]|nr:hypothetical protein C8R45DRAFT_1220516 [Mycena sanguinolenta]